MRSDTERHKFNLMKLISIYSIVYVIFLNVKIIFMQNFIKIKSNWKTLYKRQLNLRRREDNSKQTRCNGLVHA